MDSENKITYTLFCKEETIFIDESLLEPALKTVIDLLWHMNTHIDIAQQDN